ncbi:MAG: SDR family oxidoreductase [Acidimicrobiales bacterium]
MRVLFIGGTGLISSACSEQLLAAGHELWLFNRGRQAPPPGARVLKGDVHDEAAFGRLVAGTDWDVVVDWVAYVPADVARDIRTFRGSTGQYVFISSASAYEKPPSHWLVTESTPLSNPYWQYSRDKIACELLLRGTDELAWTIVRPTLTYGLTQIPVCVGSWAKPYTIVDRIRRAAPVLVPGDGTAIWTITHNRDFARGLTGLLGRAEALGEDFHITSDEALTWDQIYRYLADACGAEAHLLHVPTDALVAADPGQEGSLLGDKIYCTVFDNSKLRRLVPDFAAKVPFAEGIRETVAWLDAHPEHQGLDEAANAVWDRLAAIYLQALEQAKAVGARS